MLIFCATWSALTCREGNRYVDMDPHHSEGLFKSAVIQLCTI